jgi:transcriptional regulator with XRE-family HTH domain
MPDSFENDLLKLGIQIQKLRKRKGLSIDSLANQAGISKGNLSEIERGMRNPRYTTLLQISWALECPMSKLLS